MIRNGTITYPSVNASLQTWQPSNYVLYTFLYASLATIFAYQLAAVLFDLYLGLKPPGQTTASDISILLISEDASLFTLLANLHISPTLSRWKFHGLRSSAHHHQQCPSFHQHHRHAKVSTPDNQTTAHAHPNHSPPHCHCWRPSSRLSSSILIKLFILLLAAPLANLVAVFLTVETDTRHTFNDVTFGGLIFTIDTGDLRSARRPPVLGEVCTEYPVVLSDFEVRLSSFYYCARSSVTPSVRQQPRTALLRMSSNMDFYGAKSPREAVTIHFDNGEFLITIFVYADLHVADGGGVWRIKADFSNLDAIQNRFRQFTEKHMKGCGENNASPSITVDEKEKSWLLESQVDCSIDIDFARFALENELLIFTLVDSDSLGVFNVTNDTSKLEDAGNLVLLERRRSFMTLGILGITVAVVVVVRIVVKAITRNDVHLGIEMVLKDTLRLQRCDSMLQNEHLVDYSDRIYEGVPDLEALVESLDMRGVKVANADARPSAATVSKSTIDDQDLSKRISYRVRV